MTHHTGIARIRATFLAIALSMGWVAPVVSGLALPGLALPGLALPGLALPGLALPGLALSGLALSGLAGLGTSSPAAAQQGVAVMRGPETGLPLPRYVSLKSSEGRARRGPARTHLVDWIFTRRDMPLRVTAEFEHWRRIEDSDGHGGWMHHALLSGVRTALVMQDRAVMHSHPRAGAPERAILERGVVARILTCEAEWCRLGVDGHRGWVERRYLWGMDPHEWQD